VDSGISRLPVSYLRLVMGGGAAVRGSNTYRDAN
jgi:hypothetical protein